MYLDGIVLKHSWAGDVRNVSLLVTIAVSGDGYREILDVCEGAVLLKKFSVARCRGRLIQSARED